MRDRYPMPVVDEQIDKLHGAKYFCTLDLRNGFFHVPVAENSRKYTAFVTPLGHFEFLRVPFGLCDSPSVFQRFINMVFHDLCPENVVCIYMDDLIIFAKSLEEAFLKLQKVLEVAQRNGLDINWSKCQFMVERVEYLGYEIENGTIEPSQNKLAAIAKFAEPKNVQQIQRFLGLTGYFRRFVLKLQHYR